jgi:hypothetical protein
LRDEKRHLAFDNVVATWENAESAIILAKRHIEIERMLIRYEHKGLAAILRAKIELKKGRPKDNL